MSFVVCRTAKLRTYGKIGEAQNHNYRTGSGSDLPHVDYTKENECLHGTPNLLDDVKKRLNVAKKCAHGDFRKNAVLAVEMVLSASPQFFTSDEVSQQWVDASLTWLKNEYGDNFVNAVLHKDETTLHIQAFIVPIDEKNKLNCRAFFGGSKKMSALQTKAYEGVKHLGLKRGISKATTGREHVETADWAKEKAEIDKDVNSLTKAIDDVPKLDGNILGYIDAKKAEAYYKKEFEKAIKKTAPSKIISLTERNKELKASELLARKEKKQAIEEKEKAEKMLLEATKAFKKNLEFAEKNAYKLAVKFLSSYENKQKLSIAEKSTLTTKKKILDTLEKDLNKEFENNGISKDIAEKQIDALREKIFPVEDNKKKVVPK